MASIFDAYDKPKAFKKVCSFCRVYTDHTREFGIDTCTRCGKFS